jgi:hypothetical protein
VKSCGDIRQPDLPHPLDGTNAGPTRRAVSIASAAQH